MKDVVQTAVECEHCGEYTMFGVLMPDPQESKRLREKARLLDDLSAALGRYAEARVTRSSEAQKLWLDLLAVMDKADATVAEAVSSPANGQEKQSDVR